MQMPETIDIEKFEGLTQFTDVKGIWREGIATLEDVFAEYMGKMTAEFMSKVREFENLRK